MKKKKKIQNKKNKQSNFSKLSIFQPNKYKFKKSCPLSTKGAPIIDYKKARQYAIAAFDDLKGQTT